MRVMHETSAVSDTKEMDKYDQTTVTPTTRLSVTRGWVEENNSTRNTMTTATREELMQSLANSSTSDYCGNVSVTVSGRTCQRWDVDFPHEPYYKPEEYPELVENYCRNPNGGASGLWCYTTDPDTRWEHCVDPACPIGSTHQTTTVTSFNTTGALATSPKTMQQSSYDAGPTITPEDSSRVTVSPQMIQQSSSPGPTITPEGCKENSNGSEYRGNVSVTRNGKTCRRWDTGLSQWHRYRPELYPELVENYCRNPGGNEPGLWCYTTDPNTPREYCINPACSAAMAVKWRLDGRCGARYPAPDATPGECNPNGASPCCSRHGWCGNSRNYCSCLSGCVDYRLVQT
ncbi:plasminogen-like [Branchiostoma floridae]|uniref:Plasminogen-like n=1 Tax=Branchiostoma floridae TaxID=7739 RepID=A0A9J7LHI8_BRAFL|nr:plasminogen-like [Branchiostoma floridae]